MAGQYSGVEETGHGPTGVAGTYHVDTVGIVRYERVADRPADRTDGNWIRHFVRDDAGEAYENPFA